jgi:hypothetical protein
VKSKLIGAGLIAGATWVAYNRLSEPTPFYSPYADAATQILILGGGFGGLAATRELGHALGGRQDVGQRTCRCANLERGLPLRTRLQPQPGAGDS